MQFHFKVTFLWNEIVYLGVDVIQSVVAILRNPRACFGLLIGKESHAFGLGNMSIVYQSYTLDAVMLHNTHTLIFILRWYLHDLSDTLSNPSSSVTNLSIFTQFVGYSV